MADYTTVFDILKGFLPMNILEKAINKTGADHGTKKFTVLCQLNTMMYAHLTQKDSLRHIASSTVSNKKLQEHTGTISFSQLSRKNSQRNPEIFKIIFEVTLAKLKKHNAVRMIPGSWGTLKILDSTLIRTCLSLFPWAHFRDTKAAVKMHTLYDFESGCPENIIVTEGLTHDQDAMDSFITIPGCTYLFDRAYTDYRRFDRYCKQDIYFVSRLKKNAHIKTISENKVKEGSSVIEDKDVILGVPYYRMKHPLRTIKVIDSSTNEPFFIVTNRFDLAAEEIADIYRLRWQIEVFFKWIKQHLKIKRFYGTSYNAVLNQLYSALILFMLLKLMHILTGRRHDFLKLTRHIATGLWNTMEELIESLSVSKPPGPKRKRFNWKKEYASLLAMALVSKPY